MFCPKCGKENAGNGKFCSSCGAPLPQKNVENVQNNVERPVSQPMPAQPRKAKKGKKIAIVLALLAVVALIAGGIYWFAMPKYFEGKAEVYWPNEGAGYEGVGYGDIIQILVEDENVTLALGGIPVEGTVVSREETEKGYVYKLENLYDDEETLSLSNHIIYVQIPKQASKGELAGTWGYAIVEDRSDEGYWGQSVSRTYEEDGSIKCYSEGFGGIGKNDLKYALNEWKTKTGEEMPGYEWSEDSEKGHYIAEIEGEKYEMKVLPE